VFRYYSSIVARPVNGAVLSLESDRMTSTERRYSATDRLVFLLDDALCTVFGHPPRTRPSPADDPAAEGETTQKAASARLMRVNHAGEVCAQALYQAQALTARSDAIRRSMEGASREENDHLSWCEERLEQLGSHKSYLNPLWYGGSFMIGAAFGIAGDRWNLAFLAETERQVVQHLEGHLDKLPGDDLKSRAIVETMRDDEASHATQAVDAGAAELPRPVKRLMALTSKIMTTVAARI
jgi:ubiquinone biosynthesis monooxygenase Coq7